MATFVTLIGILVGAAGVALAVAPSRVLALISSLESTIRFRVAIGARAVIGIVFLLAAPSCRLPVVVEIVGILSLIAAVAIGLIGRARLDAMLAWWLGRSMTLLRSWSVAAIGFGALLVYAGI